MVKHGNNRQYTLCTTHPRHSSMGNTEACFYVYYCKINSRATVKNAREIIDNHIVSVIVGGAE